jgi:large exoprotein involved in heme utilization and adhesion
VQPGKTLALVGGDITLEAGNLTAASGRIELGSVAGNSLVSINSTNQGWVLSYEGAQNFQNIQLIQQTVDGFEIPSYVDASGEGGGNIQVQGRRVLLTGGSQILARTLGSQPGGHFTVTASESVELVGTDTYLTTVTRGAGNAGDLKITTGKLIARNGGQVRVYSIGSGSGGQLTVNASDSVELINGTLIQPPLPNGIDFLPSGLFSESSDIGNAGNITINTKRLHIQDGARVSAESSGRLASNQFTPATGNGGNLTVNASESIELTGTSPTGSRRTGLFAGTLGSGYAGNLKLTTGQLIIRDGAAVTVSSEVPKNYIYLSNPRNLGKAGELNVTAHSIQLDNQGKLTSETDTGSRRKY